MRPLIIERADLQTRAERMGYASLTFVCWFLWLYLFVPLFALVAWLLGAVIAYQTLLLGLDPRDLVDLLLFYGTGIAVLLGIYLSWAVISYLRFRGPDRRQAAAAAEPERLAASHHLSVPALQRLQAVRRVVLSGEELARLFAEQAPEAPYHPPSLGPVPERVEELAAADRVAV